MPSSSPKQHRFMEMIAHDPTRASELGVPQSVGEDFVQADKKKGHPFGKKGMSEQMAMAQALRMKR